MTAADFKSGSMGGARLVNIKYPLPAGQVLTGFAVGAMADSPVVFATQGGDLARYYVLPPYIALIFCVKD
jgi:hypothetical protein